MFGRNGSSCRVLRLALTLGLGLGAWVGFGQPDPAHAESYKYTDKDGVVHFTDNPYDLPEPQRSKVLRRLERKRLEQEKRREQGLEEPPPRVNERLPPGPVGINPKTQDAYKQPAKTPDTTVQVDNTAQRKLWRSKAKTARDRAATLEDKCAKLRTSRDGSKRKGLIFATPGARADGQKAAAELEKCEADLKEAKHRRDVGLPEEARRAGVPPGWLRK